MKDQTEVRIKPIWLIQKDWWRQRELKVQRVWVTKKLSSPDLKLNRFLLAEAQEKLAILAGNNQPPCRQHTH